MKKSTLITYCDFTLEEIRKIIQENKDTQIEYTYWMNHCGSTSSGHDILRDDVIEGLQQFKDGVGCKYENWMKMIITSIIIEE